MVLVVFCCLVLSFFLQQHRQQLTTLTTLYVAFERFYFRFREILSEATPHVMSRFCFRTSKPALQIYIIFAFFMCRFRKKHPSGEKTAQKRMHKWQYWNVRFATNDVRNRTNTFASDSCFFWPILTRPLGYHQPSCILPTCWKRKIRPKQCTISDYSLSLRHSIRRYETKSVMWCKSYSSSSYSH